MKSYSIPLSGFTRLPYEPQTKLSGMANAYREFSEARDHAKSATIQKLPHAADVRVALDEFVDSHRNDHHIPMQLAFTLFDAFHASPYLRDYSNKEITHRIMQDVHAKNFSAGLEWLRSIQTGDADTVAAIMRDIFFDPETGAARRVDDIKNNTVLNIIKKRCETEKEFLNHLLHFGKFARHFRDIVPCPGFSVFTRPNQYRMEVESSQNLESPSLYEFICSLNVQSIKDIHENDPDLYSEALMALESCRYPDLNKFEIEIASALLRSSKKMTDEQIKRGLDRVLATVNAEDEIQKMTAEAVGLMIDDLIQDPTVTIANPKLKAIKDRCETESGFFLKLLDACDALQEYRSAHDHEGEDPNSLFQKIESGSNSRDQLIYGLIAGIDPYKIIRFKPEVAIETLNELMDINHPTAANIVYEVETYFNEKPIRSPEQNNLNLYLAWADFYMAMQSSVKAKHRSTQLYQLIEIIENLAKSGNSDADNLIKRYRGFLY